MLDFLGNLIIKNGKLLKKLLISKNILRKMCVYYEIKRKEFSGQDIDQDLKTQILEETEGLQTKLRNIVRWG
jgi:hypothetical protein